MSPKFELILICRDCGETVAFFAPGPTAAEDQALEQGWKLGGPPTMGGRFDECPRCSIWGVDCLTCGETEVGWREDCEDWAEYHACQVVIGKFVRGKAAAG